MLLQIYLVPTVEDRTAAQNLFSRLSTSSVFPPIGATGTEPSAAAAQSAFISSAPRIGDRILTSVAQTQTTAEYCTVENH